MFNKSLQNERVLIAGAGGFIGGHLSRLAFENGARSVRCVDIKPIDEWYQVHPGCENVVLDLKLLESCHSACRDVDHVFNLAADMGGMGFIETNRALCMLNVLINTHLLDAANQAGAGRFFFASSACVYNADKQRDPNVVPLAEADAYPAAPEDGYGWEKLFSERMCRHFEEDFEIETRVARFHNIYGPMGTFHGGREKAPAAICRKVIEAQIGGEQAIEIWGDGEQTRSFTYIDDCLDGITRIHGDDELGPEPLNLGSNQLVTINQLVDIVEEIGGVQLERRYKLDAPRGVNGRNSDNTRIKQVFDWEPSTTLEDGMERTYAWIYDRMSSWQQFSDRLRSPLPQSSPCLDTSSSTSITGPI